MTLKSAVRAHPFAGGVVGGGRPLPCLNPSGMVRLGVRGPTQSKLPVDEQCRRGTSGKASFSTYLQTANEGGKPCRPNKCSSLAMPFPEAVQEADPGLLCCEWRAGTPGGLLANFGKLPRSGAENPADAKSSLGFLRAFTGKQYRRCGVLRERAWDV